jgi:hypothetical protein
MFILFTKKIFSNEFDLFRGRIFNFVRPFYELAVSDLDS